MNIEQKAKAYDKALDDIRAIYPNLKGDAKLAVEHASPELTESEDERIRKNILTKMRACQKQSNFFSNDEIAWLEKQKDSKVVKFDHDREQKPVEWSEEDEKKMFFLERLIEYNVPDGQYGWADGREGGFVTKSEAISMLKSLRHSWKPSEEQMEALKHYVDTTTDGEIDLLYNDLKASARPSALRNRKGDNTMKVNEAIQQASLNASECIELVKKIAEAISPELSERNIDIRENILIGALLTFGSENQINQAIEEMAELTAALNHFRRGRIDRDAVASEIADVIIMMEQLSRIFGVDSVHKWDVSKLDRLEKRIEESKKTK